MAKSKIKRKEHETKVKCTNTANFRIHDVAIEIWERHKGRMRTMGMYRPSAKVAIDYLIMQASMSGIYKIKPLTPKNNLYLAICSEEE